MNKGKASTSLIIAIIILIVAIVFVIITTNYAKSVNKGKTTSLGDSKIDVTTTVEEKTTLNSNNFNSSLDTIIDGRDYSGNYELSIVYENTGFYFNCTNYDEASSKCLSGSGSMNTGKVTIPLYTYEKEEDNYLNKQKDYYIIVNDNNIILSMNNNIKIYDRNGNNINNIKNSISSFKLSDEIVNSYPSISKDNNLLYYSCSNGNAHLYEVSLSDINNILLDEIVDGSSC